MRHDTDADWETWGKIDPYFGVCTQPQYRQEQMTPEAREEFFASGEQKVRDILDFCRRHIDPDFRPKRALDFGCGVGRLLLATAGIAEQVTGLDVSESMLDEARKNCEERGLNNVTLLRSDDQLSLVKGDFDFVYSHIVIQHIPVDRGTAIVQRLVDLLAPGGIGYIHVTYGHEDCPDTLGIPPEPEPQGGLGQRTGEVVHGAKRVVKKLLGRDSGPARHEPPMQMNAYDLNQILYLFQSRGATEVHATFTNHSGIFGAGFHFRKP